MTAPIFVLGFGRSGTTWVADIISKATARMVLFEPLHPSVLDDCADFAYRRILPGDAECVRLAGLYRAILRKETRRPWLLRNHVPLPLNDIDPAFLDMVWDQCETVGAKEIRGNFMAPFYQDQLGARLLFVIRDPRAVVASILKRRNFWEYGWPGTFEAVMANTVHNPRLAGHAVAGLRRLAERATTDLERVAVMWAATHAVALDDMAMLGAPIVRYEDLYTRPFDSVRAMFRSIGLEDGPIHPAYIFTPAMTTMRTAHGLYDFDTRIDHGDLDFFWDKVLSPEDAARVLEIAADFGVNDYMRKAA